MESSGAIAKKKGFATTGVDSLMKTVGLTGGAFYKHFSSKTELLQAIIEHEMALSMKYFADNPEQSFDEWLDQRVDRYLSLSHVKHPGEGCVLPALSPEIARSGDDVKATCEKALIEIKNGLARRLKNDDDAWALLAQCVGAIVIGRAMHKEGTSKAILKASKKFLKDNLRKT